MVAILLLTSLLLGAGDPVPATVEVLPVDPAALAALPRAEVRVVADGKTTVYSGVPLAAILEKRANKLPEGMPGLRDLAAAVVLVRGEDGYQAAVSAAAVLMDPKGERYLLATARDGQDRKPQLIIPADPKHARWVHEVAAIRLIRLDGVDKAKP